MESNSECSKEKNLKQELDADDTEEVKDPSPSTSKEEFDKYMQELVANDTEGVQGPRPRSDETIMQELHDLFPEPIKDSSKNLKEEEKEDYAVQNQECAEAAISFLNASRKNAKCRTEYELVEPVSSLPFMTTSGQLHYHANFKAKLKNVPVHLSKKRKKSVPEAKPELFFAELVKKEQGDPQIKSCISLGPSDSESAATGLNGCEVCSEIKIHHPKNSAFVVSGCSLPFSSPLSR